MAGKQPDFLTWAKTKGLHVNGIGLTHRPGRGRAVLARRRLKKGETILSVPIETIRSLHTVPNRVARKFPSHTSIHCLLALDIALDTSADFAPWRETMPKLEDFEAAQPFFWHEDLQALLPKPAKELLVKHQATFHEHWDLVSGAFPKLRREGYLHSWFLAGTRSFYYETPKMLEYPVMDRLALMPAADLFNHAETGCEVSFTPTAYTVSADRSYRPGEEICISYGEHSNDFLLTEYGFVLSDNCWDMVCIDDVVLDTLSPWQAAQMQKEGLLGRFLLDSNGIPCRKTRRRFGGV
ncbi:SET domain-containing protein [Coniochaeta hoffmannii]|uniref:SET domain-containing protein n=1 Tax=Coniochaeta hoffmannii TaxID=91930 RepID=A0AA38RUN0_9PEZI|nr:SET domain-containing protein [Coniochaeta hoffmannii]